VDEQLNALVQAGPSEVLIRWVNYHLAAAGGDCSVGNFGSDFTDEQVYITLISHLMGFNPADFNVTSTTTDGNDASGELKRRNNTAIAVALFNKLSELTGSHTPPVPFVLNPIDLWSGNMRLGLVMCAQLFATTTGLEVISDAKLHEVAELLLEGEEDSREERAFKLWTNNLDLQDMVIHNIFEDLRSGVNLLKIIIHLEPSKVLFGEETELCELLPDLQACIMRANFVEPHRLMRRE
jgi:plastin-1